MSADHPIPNYLPLVVDMASRTKLKPDVYCAKVLHDDWCARNCTGRNQDCNCNPTVQLDPKPYERDEPKIGRNDPCPCGSGKKYKRCCVK